MIRLEAALQSLEAVEINLQSALAYINQSIATATEIKATDLVTRLEAIKTLVSALHPCCNPIGLLKPLIAEYHGSLEDVERKIQAEQIVGAIKGLDAKSLAAAKTDVINVLAGFEVKFNDAR